MHLILKEVVSITFKLEEPDRGSIYELLRNTVKTGCLLLSLPPFIQGIVGAFG